ncbi:MAG: hypothetical protein H0T91_10490 [Propionibacteriaceae bacterium]|nr:hypothetical protein [Propionibacteriaceae bacterium]
MATSTSLHTTLTRLTVQHFSSSRSILGSARLADAAARLERSRGLAAVDDELIGARRLYETRLRLRR